MSRFKSAAATMALAGLLAGCSQSEPKATPELPERVCWGAFSGPEVNRILAPAEKVDHQADQFLLAEADDDASCRILADRVPSFVATAELLDFEGSAEREIWWFPDALPLDVGRAGSIRHGGATTYFACEPAASFSRPGKYVTLDIRFGGVPDEAKAQEVLPGLLKDFLAFAERELRCGGGAGRE
ncbi:hypothetical protein [Streptomyces cinereoruber]|uniref:hypothetical protein n=1 Tax=Streptomyces cinereoruber TaxID=67260 RepID=UPI003C2F7084